MIEPLSVSAQLRVQLIICEPLQYLALVIHFNLWNTLKGTKTQFLTRYIWLSVPYGRGEREGEVQGMGTWEKRGKGMVLKLTSRWEPVVSRHTVHTASLLVTTSMRLLTFNLLYFPPSHKWVSLLKFCKLQCNLSVNWLCLHFNRMVKQLSSMQPTKASC